MAQGELVGSYRVACLEDPRHPSNDQESRIRGV
jgi:hypothetical protein